MMGVKVMEIVDEVPFGDDEVLVWRCRSGFVEGGRGRVLCACTEGQGCGPEGDDRKRGRPITMHGCVNA